MWGLLAKITPNQIKQVRRLNDQLMQSQIMESNIQTAFTFGRRIDRNEVLKSDFSKQFDPIKDEVNRTKKKYEQFKRG